MSPAVGMVAVMAVWGLFTWWLVRDRKRLRRDLDLARAELRRGHELARIEEAHAARVSAAERDVRSRTEDRRRREPTEAEVRGTLGRIRRRRR